ncbi:MAG: hypothetical protein EON89_06270 [Brevundimonas sp.]|nr:MAG: hypothetical protein EON89_06270 [Brevundimonas sp.]
MDVAVVWAWVAGGGVLMGLARWAFDRTFAAFYGGLIGGLLVLGVFAVGPAVFKAPLFTVLLASAVAATIWLVWFACPWVARFF